MRRAQVELCCENILGPCYFRMVEARMSIFTIMDRAAIKAFQDKRLDENTELLRIAMHDIDSGRTFDP